MANNNIGESQVRVAVRVRPMSQMEIAADSRPVIKYPDQKMVQIGDGDSNNYTFDEVFPSKVSQEALFQETAPPMISSFLKGYNVTLIAYGQTGSGKTFTMGSANAPNSESTSDKGLIPRFLDEIFAQISTVPETVGHNTDTEAAVVFNPLMSAEIEEIQSTSNSGSVTVSFLEIYGDDIYDLLKPPEGDGKGRSLLLREDEGCVSVVGLTSVPINSSAEALNQLACGTERRTTGSTLMNTVSSRSHAVFTVTLHQTLDDEDVVSKISFVDLAGSERLKKTGAEGQQRKEGIQINQGLLALGNVINALGSEDALKKKGGDKIHVGYRESKLTRLLQDALGGNSRTLFLACVSPAEVNLNETLSTLRYAYRTRNIQNKAIKNSDPVKEELRRLNDVLDKMKIELVKTKFIDPTLSTEENKQNLEDDKDGKHEQEQVQLEALLQRKDVIEFMEALEQRLNIDKSSVRSKPMKVENEKSQTVALLTSSKPLSNGNAASVGETIATTAAPTTFSSSIVRRVSFAPKQLTLPQRRDDEIEMNEGEEVEEEIEEEAAVFIENDLRMVDTLIALEKTNAKFQKEHKEGDECINKVDDEIGQKEEILEKLRTDILLYQGYFAEHEALIKENDSLEAEKQQLIAQMSELEKRELSGTTTGGSSKENKGYVVKLKEQLKVVENRLKIQSSEQKKREHALELMKRDSAKCKQLESNISSLKKARVDMVKKQKESSSQFKSIMEKKNKELNDIRKSGMKEKRLHNKLECENRKLNNMMDRKVKAHQKTEQALQRNKNHLVKLLAERKREQQRQKSNKRNKSKKNDNNNDMMVPSDDVEVWAKEDQKLRTSKYVLLEMLRDRVAKRERHEKEEKLQSEYDLLQKNVFEEVENLDKLKESYLISIEQQKNNNIEQPNDLVNNNDNKEDELSTYQREIIEQEERLEEFVLKLGLVGDALSDIHLPAFEHDGTDGTDMDDDEMKEIDMISQLDASMLRTVLWSLCDGYTDVIYENLKLNQSLEKTTAEASYGKEKILELEQDNSSLRHGFHERISILHSERIELAQAICSPPGKLSKPSKHTNSKDNDDKDDIDEMENESSATALRTMNFDLEAKLEEETGLRLDYEVKLKESEILTKEYAEKLEVALLMNPNPSSSNNTDENKETNNLYEIIENIQKVWKNIDINQDKRDEYLLQIASSNLKCAENIFNNALEQQKEIQFELNHEVNHLKNIEKFISKDIISSKLLEIGYGKLHNYQYQLTQIKEINQSIQPELNEYSKQISILQKKAIALSSKLNSYESVEMEKINNLIELNIPLLFVNINNNNGDDDDKSEENFIVKSNELNITLDNQCKIWEDENRRIALKLANVQSNLHQCLTNASKQLFELDINEPKEILLLVSSQTNKKAVKNVETENNNESNEEDDEECYHYIDIQDKNQDILMKVCHQLLSQDNPVCANDNEYVLLLKKMIRNIDLYYIAISQVYENVSKLLGTWFEAALDQHQHQQQQKHDSTNINHIYKPLKKQSISKLIELAFTLLNKSKISCEGFVLKMINSWNELNIEEKDRTCIPQDWKTRETKFPNTDLQSSSIKLEKNEMIDIEYLNELSGKLIECFIEASDYNNCASIVQPLLRHMEDKTTLENDILILDQKLETMKLDTLQFEKKDPKRLADRSGKGRVELKREEQQRKQYQKDIRFLLNEIQKNVKLWESNKLFSYGKKFDYTKLSKHGQEIFDVGNKSSSMNLSSMNSISNKTSLMHLEVGIQVASNMRRNSKETPIPPTPTPLSTINSTIITEQESSGAEVMKEQPSIDMNVMSTPISDKSMNKNSLVMSSISKRNPFNRVTNSNKLRASIQKPPPPHSSSINENIVNQSSISTNENQMNHKLTSKSINVNAENMKPR